MSRVAKVERREEMQEESDGAGGDLEHCQQHSANS